MPKLSQSNRFANIKIVSTKKPVLTNRQLTRRVRGLTGLEGARKTLFQNLYNNVTLVANTADINYLTAPVTNRLIHTMRFWLRYQSVANSMTRLIVFEDTQPSQGNAVVGDILELPEPFSSYPITVHPYSARRQDKNLKTARRIRILRDFMWTANEPVAGADHVKAMKFDIKLFGRKTDEDIGYGVLIISDQANTPVDLQVLWDLTDLSA